MDWNEVWKATVSAAPAVGAAVALVALILKIRESSRRSRAHSIAVESYALAKFIGELGPGDAGFALNPSLRNDLLRTAHKAARRYQQLTQPKRRIALNWAEVVGYSLICWLIGNALWQVITVFHLAGGPWELSLNVLGGFFILLGLYVFGSLVVLVIRRRKAFYRLLRLAWRDRESRRNVIEATESPGAL